MGVLITQRLRSRLQMESTQREPYGGSLGEANPGDEEHSELSPGPTRQSAGWLLPQHILLWSSSHHQLQAFVIRSRIWRSCTGTYNSQSSIDWKNQNSVTSPRGVLSRGRVQHQKMETSAAHYQPLLAALEGGIPRLSPGPRQVAAPSTRHEGGQRGARQGRQCLQEQLALGQSDGSLSIQGRPCAPSQAEDGDQHTEGGRGATRSRRSTGAPYPQVSVITAKWRGIRRSVKGHGSLLG